MDHGHAGTPSLERHNPERRAVPLHRLYLAFCRIVSVRWNVTDADCILAERDFRRG